MWSDGGSTEAVTVSPRVMDSPQPEAAPLQTNQPLMTIFRFDSGSSGWSHGFYDFDVLSPRESVDLTTEAVKEILWEKHCAEFGSGVSMYRTQETTHLVAKGIPNKVHFSEVSFFL